MQVGGFVVLFVSGICSGLVFDLSKLFKFITKNFIAICVIADFLSVIIGGAFFCFAEYYFLDFKLYGFGVIAFLLGFFVERISIGFLLAKTGRWVYNVSVKVNNRLKSTKIFNKIYK